MPMLAERDFRHNTRLPPSEWKSANWQYLSVVDTPETFTRVARVVRVQQLADSIEFVRQIGVSGLSELCVRVVVQPQSGTCLFILDLFSPRVPALVTL